MGQVWKRITGNEYSIKSLGRVKVGDDWFDSVTYWLNKVEKEPVEYTRTLDDFLAKFSQVV